MNNIFPLKHTFTGKYMITYARVPTWILHTEQIHEKEFNFINIEWLIQLLIVPDFFLHSLKKTYKIIIFLNYKDESTQL